MRVYGTGKILPPIRTDQNGKLVFYVQSGSARIQVKSPSDRRRELTESLVNNKDVEIVGELVSFVGKSGPRYVVIT